jgi:hypothetical protein
LMERACQYIQSLSPVERLRKAGILSGNFWLPTYNNKKKQHGQGAKQPDMRSPIIHNSPPQLRLPEITAILSTVANNGLVG